MRQIALDTETTGLDWQKQQHRIIEIGAVEMIDRQPTGRHYHVYLNPQRDIDEAAQRVHGISAEFLADKPLFADEVESFTTFIRGAELIIHNAAFDVGFLNYELSRLEGAERIEDICAGVIDSLALAREQNPGKKASLDALCDRYQIDNTHRSLHGALLDAEILVEVYLAMTRGQENLLGMLEQSSPLPMADQRVANSINIEGQTLMVIHASAEEQAAHISVLEGIAAQNKGQCLWPSDIAMPKR